MQPVVDIRRGVSTDAYSVFAGVVDLYESGNILFAGIVFAFSVVFPIAKLATVVVLIFRPVEAEKRRRQLTLLNLLGRWSMLDVFIVAILIGALSLGILANAEARGGIYVFGLAILLSMITTMQVAAWAEASTSHAASAESTLAGPRGRLVSLLALLVFFGGLFFPLMELEKLFFWKSEYSLLEGIGAMWREGDFLLALFLCVFVVVLPFARMSGLVFLRWARGSASVERAVRMLEKWSMLDVFVLALLVVAAKIGDVAHFEPRIGFWCLLTAAGLSVWDSWVLSRLGSGQQRRTAS